MCGTRRRPAVLLFGVDSPPGEVGVAEDVGIVGNVESAFIGGHRAAEKNRFSLVYQGDRVAEPPLRVIALNWQIFHLNYSGLIKRELIGGPEREPRDPLCAAAQAPDDQAALRPAPTIRCSPRGPPPVRTN